MEQDIIVIGAGIVGLASALKILEKKPYLKVLILEKEDSIAKHQTGNNSGVIHSGIYYKPGSLKALNCITGYKMLIDFCNVHNIKYDICGKVIVAATTNELQGLENIFDRGIKNGLTGLKKLSKSELQEKEPHVNGIKAVFVPQTGIIDYTEVCLKYLELIKQYGGEIEFNNKVIDIKLKNTDCEVITEKGNFNSKTVQPFNSSTIQQFNSSVVVTCAGLFSDRIAKMTHPELKLRIIPFRGEYYVLKDDKRSLVNSLIYPVPDPAFPFLGVHFTRMIDGQVECGPNAVLALKREGYTKTSFNLRDTIETLSWRGFHKVIRENFFMGMGEYYRSFNKNAFVRALQKLIPEISSEDLIPGGAGVRAQACDKFGGLIDDFHIIEDSKVIHVCNAPSPAATASLSIGNFISEKVMSKYC